jgi:ubiquinone/menaquinone biosynthesis C-methylase UbiE
MTPNWKLPPGTDRGLWDYVSSERVAREYDEALAGSPLLEMDLRFADERMRRPGRLIDLGCGTGRALVHFARRGFQCLGVDLSETMLDIVRQKAEREGLIVDRLKANIVELDVLPAAEFDYALCLFSTLGMIRGVENRRQFLGHVRRILKPGGVFVLHVHNARYRFGRGLGKPGPESGDHTMPQHRGGAELTIHHYTRREIAAELSATGFQIREAVPVGTGPGGRLAIPRWLASIRAHGFLIAAIRA